MRCGKACAAVADHVFLERAMLEMNLIADVPSLGLAKYPGACVQLLLFSEVIIFMQSLCWQTVCTCICLQAWRQLNQ